MNHRASLLLALCLPAILAVSTSLAGQTYVLEKEDNDAAVRATPLGGANVVGRGSIYPQPDTDYWSFSANAGDRVYAATMTSGSAATNFDTVLDLLSSNGTTVLETDDNDGSFSGVSSSIAGRVIPTSGTYYLRVTAAGFLPQVTPYFLHLQVRSAAPVVESEPNNSAGAATPLGSGHVSGVHAAGDADWFSLSLQAGDSVFLSLDGDPERNAVTWNPRLAFGLFGDALDQLLVADDNSTTTGNSEALFATVKNAGTYFVRVDSAASPGGAGETYVLSASVHSPSSLSPSCITYTSGSTPLAIPDGGGPVTATIVVPNHQRIFDLDVSLQLTHPVMADLDVHLIAPVGNDVGLFTDVGSAAPGGQAIMDLVVDDGAALPIGAVPVMKGISVQPEAKYRLAWFDGEDPFGTWTLQLWDDTVNGSAGNLTGWSITVCEAPAEPVCAGTMVTLYSSDFETDDGGFTHSGTNDQWALGLPSGNSAPILSCNSGSNCWKTNLSDVYADGALMLLRSPQIDLAPVTPPIRARWAQAFQMENAVFDAMEVDVDDLITTNIDNLYLWLDASQDEDVGVSNLTYVSMSAGWGVRSGNLDANAGNVVQLVFGLLSDNFVGYSGLAIDDVTVTGCCAAACCTNAQCDDGDPCTVDSCDAGFGCLHLPLTGPACDDANSCTANDACLVGVCVGTTSTPAAVGNSVNLSKSGTTSSVQWSDLPGPFNVYRGSRTGAGWSYDHTCFESNLAAPPSTDASVPSSGTAYYYLVSRDGACAESSLGTNSAGNDIPNANPCP